MYTNNWKPAPGSSSPLRDILLPLFLVGASLLFSAFFVLNRCAIIDNTPLFTMGDDAYISMRYAQNLINGDGLSWNRGETPVEGFTNLLWVLWIAFLMLFSKDPSLLMGAGSALLNTGAVYLLWKYLRNRLQTPAPAAAAAALLLAAWPPVHDQTANGLEGPLLLFLFMTALYTLSAPESHPKTIATGAWLSGLLPLVRPNGLLFTGFLLLLFTARFLPKTHAQWTAFLKKWRWTLAGFLAPFILLTLFRIAYFGDWQPNTYYLKVTNRPGRLRFGLGYVKRFLLSFWGSPLLLLAGACALIKKNTLQLKLILLTIFATLASTAWQGGDTWEGWRFMLLALPLLLIAAMHIYQLERPRLPRPPLFLAGAFLLMLISGAYTDLFSFFNGIRRGAVTIPTPPAAASAPVNNIRLGLMLKEACAKDAVIAEFWAGATPFYSELTALDMLGKSDRHIARLPARVNGGLPGHDKYDFGYIFSLQPDVIVSRYKLWASRTPAGLNHMRQVAETNDPAGAALILHPRFSELYRPFVCELSKNWRAVYVRKNSAKFNDEKARAAENRLLNLPKIKDNINQ